MQSILKRLRRVLVHLVLIITCAISIFPVLWTVSTSLKPEADVLRYPPVWIPNPVELSGYREALSGASRLLRYMGNTVIYAVASTAISVILASLAGYAFSRFRFPGRQLALLSILGTVMIPGLTQTIPLYAMFARAKLLNTYLGLIIIYSAYHLPFAIWIMKSFFDTIPVEMEEAARIDGCGPIQALLRVILPISTPGVVSVSMMNLVGTWKEFFTNLIFTRTDEMRNVNVGLYNFLSTWYGSEYHRLMSAAVLVLIPVIVVFLLARKQFMESMVEGALKGA